MWFILGAIVAAAMMVACFWTSIATAKAAWDDFKSRDALGAGLAGVLSTLIFGVALVNAWAGWYSYSTGMEQLNSKWEREAVVVESFSYRKVRVHSSDGFTSSDYDVFHTDVTLREYPEQVFVVSGMKEWRPEQRLTLVKQLYKGRWIGSALEEQ